MHDLTGLVFGKLTVIGMSDEYYVEPKTGVKRVKWRCKCECGNFVNVVGGDLTRKNRGTKSCGCIVVQAIIDASKKYNQYDLSGEYGIGYCSNTGNEFYFDLEDYDKIKDYCWYELIGKKDEYHSLCTMKPMERKQIKMHQVLGFDAPDHIDRNPLNNRKTNLRTATTSQNMCNRSLFKNNTSGYTGVYQRKHDGKWVAQITIESNQIYVGQFDTKEEAILARLNAEATLHKDFASQKHLYDQYGVGTQTLEVIV
jgi:hypothetical protein